MLKYRSVVRLRDIVRTDPGSIRSIKARASVGLVATKNHGDRKSGLPSHDTANLPTARNSIQHWIFIECVRPLPNGRS